MTQFFFLILLFADFEYELYDSSIGKGFRRRNVNPHVFSLVGGKADMIPSAVAHGDGEAFLTMKAGDHRLTTQAGLFNKSQLIF